MTTIIIAFPPGAGGNHLKNILTLEYKTALDLYNKFTTTFHTQPGMNLKEQSCMDALSIPGLHILHGHFAEIMSYQKYIDQIQNKKFIILSPDTPNDRALLRARQKSLGQNQTSLSAEDYFDQEQVFLYEPFMYNRYFNTSMSQIMNISISEWFTDDIDPVIKRLNQFLEIDLDVNHVKRLHDIWLTKARI
jgi:hypothetical protein